MAYSAARKTKGGIFVTLDEAIDKVVEGFEKSIFVRNTEDDFKSGWGIRLAPYLQALAILEQRAAEIRS